MRMTANFPESSSVIGRPDAILPDRTLLEAKSAAKQVKNATYGMLYGSNPQMDEMLWTGIQRLLAAKGLNPGTVDGKPGPQTYEALSKLVTLREGQELVVTAQAKDWTGGSVARLFIPNGKVRGLIGRVQSRTAPAPDVPTNEANDTSEIDSARFRLLEKKP